MFGGNFSDNCSLYYQNYGTGGGTMYTVQLAYLRIYNCIFINQSSFETGFIINYFRNFIQHQEGRFPSTTIQEF